MKRCSGAFSGSILITIRRHLWLAIHHPDTEHGWFSQSLMACVMPMYSYIPDSLTSESWSFLPSLDRFTIARCWVDPKWKKLMGSRILGTPYVDVTNFCSLGTLILVELCKSWTNCEFRSLDYDRRSDVDDIKGMWWGTGRCGSVDDVEAEDLETKT